MNSDALFKFDLHVYQKAMDFGEMVDELVKDRIMSFMPYLHQFRRAADSSK
jgi:hypothetical protein